MIDKKSQGKKNRAAGKRFELKVREDLEKKGWIVFRNSNDVEFETQTKSPDVFLEEKGDSKIAKILEYERFIGKFKQSRPKFNPFTKQLMMMQSGFPDFICVRFDSPVKNIRNIFEVMFVECKGGDEKHKYLDEKEKMKVEWIKQNLKIPVIIANKSEKRGEIKYVPYE